MYTISQQLIYEYVLLQYGFLILLIGLMWLCIHVLDIPGSAGQILFFICSMFRVGYNRYILFPIDFILNNKVTTSTVYYKCGNDHDAPFWPPDLFPFLPNFFPFHTKKKHSFYAHFFHNP